MRLIDTQLRYTTMMEKGVMKSIMWNFGFVHSAALFLCIIGTQSSAQQLDRHNHGSAPGLAAVPVDETGAVHAAAAIAPHDTSFIIGTSDVLAVDVWKEPEISRAV